jgi:hypothetical protein
MIRKSIVADLSCVFSKCLIGIRMTNNLKKANILSSLFAPVVKIGIKGSHMKPTTPCLVMGDLTPTLLQEWF